MHLAVLCCLTLFHFWRLATCEEVVFTKPDQITNEDDVIVIGLTLININHGAASSWSIFSKELFSLVHSLLAQSSAAKIHFVTITDENTLNGKNSNVFR